MKRISILWMVLFTTLTMNAQLPDNWIGDSGIELFQETATVHGGDYSAGIIVNSDVQADCDLINQVDLAVNAGEPFKVSFWGVTSPHVLVRVFFYWEGASTNFTPEYLSPGTDLWEEFSYEDIVPGGATALKIGLRFYDVTGFSSGEVQYVDDVTFESPPGNPVPVANGEFESWSVINPEPDNYPTGFTATQKGLSALLSWTDASGGQLPDNYLIFGTTLQTTAIPQDGNYYPDDLDFSDGEGFVNITYGMQQFTFSNLEILNNYTFTIFPYTNSGTNINYKTDGVPPESFVEIPNVIIIREQDFNTSWDEWQAVNVLGEQVWNNENNFGIDDTPCARITGNVGGLVFENQDWIISPPMDFTLFENTSLSFYTSVGYLSPEAQFSVKISSDYTNNGNPSSATWENLNPVLPDGSVNWKWTNSGENDISGFNGENVFVAFVYECGTETAATWQLDNILITGEILPRPEPDNYPVDFLATANETNIDLSWIDAGGEVLPDAYLILGSDQENISSPSDGSPVADDTDFSDGTASLNVLPGIQAAGFANLISGKTYYFKIFPYTNSENQIDYKSDGLPPSASALILVPVDILYTDFNTSWGGWIPFSLFGNQSWGRNNDAGIENSPCALISGFEGEPFFNEDWLISPQIELSESTNIKMHFYNATENSGQEILLKLSTDYNGSGNPNDYTWVDLSENVNWSQGNFSWTNSGDIYLTDYSGGSIYLAFIYFSDENDAATWGVDDVIITEIPVLEEPTNYPGNFSLEGEYQQITVRWQDATGEISPWGYLLKISDKDDFTLPENGVPEEDDLDFSDGNGTVNVLPTTEEYTFSGLADSTTYSVSIIPYSNSHQFIKYKTSPDPPKGSASTAPPDGLWDVANTINLNIYPNPGKGLFYFKAENIIRSIQVYAINGKLIYDKDFSASSGHIDLRDFETGMYIAVFKIDGTHTFKTHIVIQ